MLSVLYKAFLLSVVKLNVVMMIAVAPATAASLVYLTMAGLSII